MRWKTGIACGLVWLLSASQPTLAQQAEPIAPPSAGPQSEGLRSPLDRLGTPDIGPLGSPPRPTARELQVYNDKVRSIDDPTNTLDLIVNIPRILHLTALPKRVQSPDAGMLDHDTLDSNADSTYITIIGKRVGTTVFNLWFDDAETGKEVFLSYLVRILPDPMEAERIERILKKLEMQINKTFPDSSIKLTLLGERIVVSGLAHDVEQKRQILSVVESSGSLSVQKSTGSQIPVDAVNMKDAPAGSDNRPGRALENFITSPGGVVIDNLRVVGEQNVQLTVTIAEVERAALRTLGLRFGVVKEDGRVAYLGTGGAVSASAGDFRFGATIPNPVTGFPTSIDNGTFQLGINAMRSLRLARSLAEPVLVVQNGRTGTFTSGGNFPVPVVTDISSGSGGGVTDFIGNRSLGAGVGTQFQPYGIELEFTPYVRDRDQVLLQFKATVEDIDRQTGGVVGGTFVPGTIERTVDSTVTLRDGQYFAVAGLILNNFSSGREALPGAGDLPVFGPLFGGLNTGLTEKELVFLINVQLVHPLEENEVPPLPGSDMAEPDDLEFYLFNRLESSRTQDWRSTIRTDFSRLLTNRQYDRIFIHGPTGHSDGR